MKPQDSKPQDSKPQGRDEVRRSILRAARQHFAREGTRGSLRDIAATARVNVGLIHRHFGRKDQLVDEVISDTLDRSARALEDDGTVPDAIRQMFLGATGNTDFVRTIAWLALEGDGTAPSPLAGAQHRNIARVRALSPQDPDHDLRLMAALTVLWGWSIFNREILSAFDIDDADRPTVEARMADLLAELVDDERPTQ